MSRGFLDSIVPVVLLLFARSPSAALAQDFTRVKQCVDPPGGFCAMGGPQISPDGRWFAAYRCFTYPPTYECFPTIWGASLDGSSAFEVFTSGLNSQSSPAWSSDGSHLAFVTFGFLPEDSGLWIVDVSDPDNVGSPKRIVAGEAEAPAWSRDGRIAYMASGGIWSVAVAGGTPTLLHATGRSPHWGANGQIVFVESNDLWIRDDDGDVHRLTNTPWSERSPAWSPGGTWIAYSADRDSSWDLFVIAATGGTAVRLTTDPRNETSPSWSGDGATIMYETYTESEGEFWIATNLPDFTTRVSEHTWSQMKRLYR